MTPVGKPFAAPLVGLCLAAAACHPTGVDSTSDYSTVTTAHDATYNFGAAKTYSLPNVVISVGVPDAGPPNPVNPQIQQAILTSIQTQMNARGYQEVPPAANPDLIATAAFLQVTNIAYYYSYWCGYWALYYPCYPYYPPIVGISSYTVGTVNIDLASAQPTETRYDGVWTAIVRGVGSGNTTTDSTRIAAGISQAFIQSPYVESAQ
jgi:hypothetical protein